MIAVRFQSGALADSILAGADPLRQLEIITRWARRGMYPATFLRKMLAIVVGETDPTDGEVLKRGLTAVDAIDQLERSERAA